ncbi:hypothetical protein [Thalassotalea sp. G2M2-11]|uniref:hypothetical protein n=1 Tax=Thalassotalea sp. G2M2-11 TaxID=2787627 RepID=UPI0019CF522D|nr:hypothetical protein [Thalassotalea sp. G2M2-11]
MLINIVVLVLRDLLPLAVLFVWLFAYIYPALLNIKKLAWLCVISCLGVSLLFNFAPVMSEYFGGAGLELALVLLTIIIYLSCLVASIFTLNERSHLLVVKLCFMLGLSSFIVIKGANFLIYFLGYLARSADNSSVILGVALALGITFSFCILLYFTLSWCRLRGWEKLLNFFWAIYLGSLLAQIVPMLAQIDLVTDAIPLWDSRWLMADKSEYGHIFKALVGYEATPSLSYLLIYLMAIVLFYLAMLLNKYVTNFNHEPLNSTKVEPQ